MLFGIAPFEGISVGIDPRSPVSWDLYERFGPFPYTGALAAVTYTPGEPAPDAPGAPRRHAARARRTVRVTGGVECAPPPARSRCTCGRALA